MDGSASSARRACELRSISAMTSFRAVPVSRSGQTRPILFSAMAIPTSASRSLRCRGPWVSAVDCTRACGTIMRLRVSSPRRTVMTFSSAPQEMYRWVNQWNHRARFGIGLWGTSSTAKLGQIASRTRSRSLPVPTGSRSDSVFPSLPSTVTWTLWYPQMRHNNDWVISTPWMRWTGMVLVSRLVNPCTDFNPSPERYKVSPQLFESLVHR